MCATLGLQIEWLRRLVLASDDAAGGELAAWVGLVLAAPGGAPGGEQPGPPIASGARVLHGCLPA